MKVIFFLSILLSPFFLFCQNSYDKKQDTKINKSVTDISALQTSVNSVKSANTSQDTKLSTALSTNNSQTTLINNLAAQVAAQSETIRKLNDTLQSLKVLLSGDFLITGNKITIPQLKILSDRIAKLEAKLP